MTGTTPEIPGTRLVGAALAAAAAAMICWGFSRVAPGALAAPSRWPDARVDVNAATPSELCLLPGVGPGLADRIAADRALRGPFDSLDDLDRVHGIGAATLDRLRSWAVAGDGE